MPSPFPGMNPYLEQDDVWEDFHHDWLIRAREALNPQVGPDYLVKIEVRLYLRELSEDERRFFGRSDVAVAWQAGEQAQHTAATTIAAPIQLTLPAVDSESESWLEIRDRRDRRLVTVIELLSPSNKTPGADRDAYLGKRRRVLGSMAHFVEIDLRRGGERPRLPELPPCDYYALVSRYAERPRLDLWPVGLRERLPVVPVPLDPADADARLDLQAVLDCTYDAAGYAKYVYADSPQPPLSPADAEWAKQFVPHRES